MRRLVLIVGLVAVVLALTNPGPDRYERYVDEVVTHILIAEAEHLPGGDLIVGMAGPVASRVARRHTERDDYLLFSIYRLDMRVVGLPDQEWRFLGIGSRFIEIARPAALRG